MEGPPLQENIQYVERRRLIDLLLLGQNNVYNDIYFCQKHEVEVIIKHISMHLAFSPLTICTTGGADSF